MSKKSGTAGTPVELTAPVAPHEADNANPGEVEKITFPDLDQEAWEDA
jgi:hypothetical protein